MKQTDVLIVGGGSVGVSLAIALEQTGLDITLVEASNLSVLTQTEFDARSLALSFGSQRILNTLGLWRELAPLATPIMHINVSEQGRFGAVRLDADDTPLGYVIEIAKLNLVLQKRLKTTNRVNLIAPAKVVDIDAVKACATIDFLGKKQKIQAKLIVAADGANSDVRRMLELDIKSRDYNQHAIVANIGLKREHSFKAYERFTQFGPIAMLPMSDKRASLVWAMPPLQSKKMMGLSDEMFLSQLQRSFGYRMGRLVKVGKRFSFPLKLTYMPQQSKNSVVFVGNAAHSLHPIAGQGFNLSLRDVASLAQCIALHGLDCIAHYEASTKHSQNITMSFTDGLVRLFTHYFPLVKVARNSALVALENVTPAKNLLARYAMGLGGRAPDLVCGIQIE
jgi:2-octaprenyl-6-methoxyphenol hydroxylase